VKTTTGLLRLFLSNDGSAEASAESTAATGFTDGTSHWIRCTWSESGSVANFYTSNDAQATNPSSVSWTQLGDADLTLTMAGIFDTDTALIVGANNAGTGNNLAGKVYRAQVYDGIDGTLVADYNAADGDWQNPKTITSTATGEVYTVNGDAFLDTAASPKVYEAIAGYFGEGEAQNVFLNSSVPVTQDVTLGVGDFTLSVHGAGTVTSSAGTATGTGYGAATDGTNNTIDVTGGGTVTFTVTGSPDYVQVESGYTSTSPIITLGAAVTRLADTEATLDLANFSDAEGSMSFELTPYFDTALATTEGIITPNATAAILAYFATTAKALTAGDGTTTISKTSSWASPGQSVTFKMRWGNSLMNISVNGVAATEVAYDGSFSPSGAITLFKSLTLGAAMKDLQIWSVDKGSDWLS